MIASKISHQNLSDYIPFLFKKRFQFNKKRKLFLVKKLKIQIIITMNMLTPSEIIFNPSCYTGKLSIGM